MLLFIDFIIQHGEVTSSSGFNGWTLLNSLAGSGLGFFGAWVLFNKTQKRTSERDEKLRIQGFRDKYTYFKSLLDKTPGIIEITANYYKDFANETRQNPYKIHIPRQTITTPIKRLIDSKDHEAFFTAFINQLKSEDKKVSIESFEKIYSTLDYYYQTLEQSLDSIKILRERIRNAMELYKNSLGDVEHFAANLLVTPELQNTHGALLNNINNLFQAYIPAKAQHPTDLKFHFDNFVIPLRDACIAVAGYDNLKIRELLSLIKSNSEHYSAIEFLSNSQAEEFEDYNKLLSAHIEDLKKEIDSLKL